MLTLNTEGLIGRPFVYGETDCFTLGIDFFKMNSPVRIPHFATEDLWWDHGQNHYMDLYPKAGFLPVDMHPRLWKPGMVILMAIISPVANHAGILLENGMMLHHLYGQRSIIEPYNRPIYRNNTMAVLQHPDAVYVEDNDHMIDAMTLIPDSIKRKLDQANG